MKQDFMPISVSMFIIWEQPFMVGVHGSTDKTPEK